MPRQAIRIAIQIDDPLVSRAVHYVIATEPRWTLCQNPEPSDVRLTGLDVGNCPDQAGATILVTSARPARASSAIDAFTSGVVDGIVSTDELGLLPDAISAVTTGLATVSPKVRDAAKIMPRLSGRKLAVIAKLAVGCSSATISAQLHVSESTIKREVQELCAAFEASSRAELLAAAAAAGLVSAGSRGD